MKTKMVKALVIVGLISQIACESAKNKNVEMEVGKNQVYISSTMASADLVEAAEQLITPTQFMTADAVLDMALEKDPANFKAQFYKKFLASYMLNKGILTRIKPLVRKHGNISEYEKSINALPDIPAYRFLVKGDENITKVSDVQAYLSDYQDSLNDFRKFLIQNQDQQLTVEISSTYLENLFKQGDAYDCTQVTEGHYQCDIRNITKRKLSTPDFMAIRQILAGQILFLNFYTAYSFEGIEVLKSLNIKDGTPQDEVITLINEKLPELGKLRSQNLMKETMNLGSDLVSAGRWAIQYQNQLCPNGVETTQQRKGFMFNRGLCVKNADQALRSLAMMEQVLTSTMKVKVPNTNTEFEMDYMAWFKNPVQDLVTLAPKTYNSCGQATSYRDSTYGGVFVNGDADKYLVAINDCK